jgi:hypothetical protein
MKKNKSHTPSHANKRSPSQRDADLQSIAKMSLQGMVEVAITAELNRTNPYSLSRSQVHSDLAELRRFWRDKAAGDTAEQLGFELAKLNHVEQVGWEGFDKSHEVNWLNLVLKASAQRVSLLGLAKPVVMQFSTPDGGPIAVLQVPPRGTLDRNA